jgi:hypothetical protein
VGSPFELGTGHGSTEFAFFFAFFALLAVSSEATLSSTPQINILLVPSWRWSSLLLTQTASLSADTTQKLQPSLPEDRNRRPIARGRTHKPCSVGTRLLWVPCSNRKQAMNQTFPSFHYFFFSFLSRWLCLARSHCRCFKFFPPPSSSPQISAWFPYLSQVKLPAH